MKTSTTNAECRSSFCYLPDFAIFSLYFEEKHGYSKTDDEFKKEINQAGIKVCEAGIRVHLDEYQVVLREDFKRCDYESFSEYF